jgi:hypothetical protein
MRWRLAALLVLAAFPAAAAEPPAQRDLPPGLKELPQATEKLREDLARAAEAMRDSMGQALLSLEAVIRQLPRYEPPEFTENGDIIIRRKPPENPQGQRQDGTI